MFDWDDDGDIDAGDWAMSLLGLDTASDAANRFVAGGRDEDDRRFRAIVVLLLAGAAALLWWFA